MSDLISRATLLKALRKEQRECEKDGEEFGGESILFAEAFEDVIDMVKTLPTVDAVPVVHARWKRHDEDWRHQIAGNECSACGFVLYGVVGSYCSRCGAKMDGGAKDAAD